MSDFKNYDPALVMVTFAGIPIRGFTDGSSIKVERAEDAFSMKIGALGDQTRIKSRNRSGSVTVTLLGASPSNDELATRADLDELDGSGSGPLLLKDLNGTTFAEAPNAWIKKKPDAEYGQEPGDREWIIDCGELIYYPGGALT